ncbi:MAG: hypothetical protein H6981_12195 [Gammaproteobacteria bacterium]|nr:hypothetical protein [Gammaproteobacteria bacterium]MCP5137550.1 hypothetical protein [Gammaproteobacteria bacterium]
MKRLLAGLVLILAATSQTFAGDYEYNAPAGSQMAETMWDMMDWMRGENGGPFRFNSNPLPGMNSFSWPGMGMTGMPSYMDGMPMMNNFGDVYQASPWSQLPGQMDRFQQPGGWADSQRIPPTDPRSPTAQTSSRLDGMWRSTSGEVFMIEGERFRIVDTAGDYLDGRIQVVEDRLRTYLPLTEQVRDYRFVKVGRMLMLRDESDQTLVFERVYR